MNYAWSLFPNVLQAWPESKDAVTVSGKHPPLPFFPGGVFVCCHRKKEGAVLGMLHIGAFWACSQHSASVDAVLKKTKNQPIFYEWLCWRLHATLPKWATQHAVVMLVRWVSRKGNYVPLLLHMTHNRQWVSPNQHLLFSWLKSKETKDVWQLASEVI